MFRIIISGLFLVLTISGTEGGQPVYVSNGSHILSYLKDDIEVGVVLGQTGYRIVGLAVDIGNDVMFWSDISTDYHGIYTSSLHGENVTCIVKDITEVNGVSVDWVSRHVYWTDSARKTIEIANYDGTGRRVLVSDNLKSPSSILASPIYGYLFWVDQRSKRIERAWLDGTSRRTVVKSSSYYPNQLAISHKHKQLYWVDAGTHSIYSCSLSGKRVKKQVNYKKISGGAPGFGLIVFGNTAVVSTWFNTAIYSMLLESRKTIFQQEVKGLGTRELFSLVSLNPSMQPMTVHPCMESDNAGCSHLCLPSHGSEYHCSCPTYGGLTLADDNVTCQVPSEILLCTFRGTGDIGFIPFDITTPVALTLITKSTNPAAIAYNPKDQMIYWSDKTEHAILRVRLDGTEREVFLNSSHGIGDVDSLVLDRQTGVLYFTNSGQTGASIDNIVYGWSRVESIDIHTRSRTTILHDVTQPRVIMLDTKDRYLYVVDSGDRVVKMELDGSDPVILDTGHDVSPFGLIYKEQDVTKQIMMAVEEIHSSVDQNEKTVTPTIKTDSKDMRKKFYNELERFFQNKKPAGFFHSSTTNLGDNDHQSACLEAGCSHGCIPLPKVHYDHFRCTCPQEQGLMIGQDRKKCQVAKNFLLYADMTTINMLSLDEHTSSRPLTLYYGDTSSNIMTLTFDKINNRVYWVDTTKNQIFMSSLHHFSPVIVYQEVGPVDGLVFDSFRQRLYWTCTPSNSRTGYIAGLNIERGLSSYKILLQHRNKPKALALHPNGKWLYWAESKDNQLGAEIHSCKTNGNRYRVLITQGVYWPNSLYVTEDQLYIGESSGKVLVTDLYGDRVREFYSPNTHVFDVQVQGNILLYSDWLTSSVNMVDMATKHSVILATNLTRPTSIVLQHLSNLTDACFEANVSPCSDICVPLFWGEFECMCTGNRILQLDGKACLDEDEVTSSTEMSSTRMTTTTTTMQTTSLSNSWPATSTLLILSSSFTPASSTTSVSTSDELSSSSTLSASTTTTTTHTYPGHQDNTTSVSMETLDTKQGRPYAEPKPTMSTQKQTEWNYSTTTPKTEYREKIYVGKQYDNEYDSVEDNDDDNESDYDDENTTELEETIIKNDVAELLIDQPYFEACPSRETIIADIPESDTVVLLPIKPIGYDSAGGRLPLHCNYEMNDNGVVIPWTGDGEESQHDLVFKVTDNNKHTTICRVKVILQDVDPPKFKFCPSTILVKTAEDSEHVHWDDPEAVDNIGIRRVTGDHAPGSMFPPGESTVNYTAVDMAGNQAYCSFKVMVFQDALCNLPPIENGGIICNHGDDIQGECHIVCHTGNVVNPIRVFRRLFNCKHPDEIDSLHNIMLTQKPCLNMLYPSIIQQEFSLLVNGPINKHRSDVMSNFSLVIANHLEREELCVGGVCQLGNMSVPCDLEISNQNETEMCIEDLERDTFSIMFNVTLRNDTGPEELDVQRLLQEIDVELRSLTTLLQIQLEEHFFSAIAESLSTTPVQWSCPMGQISEKDICIACPPGTLHNMSLDICQYCSMGQYQDTEGQVTCKSCDPRETSADGATSHTQCHTLPSMDEMTLFIIVTACSFGVVFLCMAITLYLQFQRQQKRNQQSSNPKKTRYNMSPNIYVAPPPILKSKLDENWTNGQRTYSIDQKRPINIYSNPHDYEDVDNQRMSSPRSVFSNDMFTMSPGQGLQMNRDYSPGDEVPTGTLSRENTFSNATYSPQFGVKRSDKTSLKGYNTSSPRQQRKMSHDSTFSNHSPKMMRAHLGTPTSDTPLITQSPLLRMKLAAYNLNHED